MSEDTKHLVWIQSWDASYYEPVSQKWLYGQLKLATDALLFAINKTSTEPSGKSVVFYQDFANIKCINKAMSSMIFPSLTVRIVSDETHWFSSLQDRNGAFVVISHFFEASLLTPYSRGRQSNEVSSAQFSSQRTELGTVLLNCVHDSDITLRKAASSLVQQGEQLAAISCTMQDIQQDLTVAERVTAGLNSWLGRWKIPKSTTAGELILLKDNDIPNVLDVEVLYTKVFSSRIGPQTCGVCRVAADGISVLDLKQKVVHHFKWSEISRVRAVSPWEIIVTQYLIGKPDMSYNIVTVHTPSILSKVTRLAGSKIEYMEPPPHALDPNTDSKVLDLSAEPPPYNGSDNAVDVGYFYEEKFTHPEFHQTSTSKMKEKVISDAEVDELSLALSSIKNTALGINAEQDSQLHDIDELTSSVDRANDRIRAMNKTMGKLLK